MGTRGIVFPTHLSINILYKISKHVGIKRFAVPIPRPVEVGSKARLVWALLSRLKNMFITFVKSE